MALMYEENENIRSKDGLKLIVHHWHIKNPEKILCIVHGLGEHGGRYEHLAHFLNQSNITVMSFDMRGHGLSDGKRGYIPSYNALLDDIDEVLKYLRSEYNDVPLILMGHSLGGNLVANYMNQDETKELSGFILSSPFFRATLDPPPRKVKMAKIISLVWQGFTQKSQLDTKAISRIPAEIETYENDPLIHDKISVRLYLESSQKGMEILKNTKLPSKPILLYHGTADRLTSHDSSSEFAHKFPENIQWHSISEAYHETHNDCSRELVYDLLLNFIKTIPKINYT